MSDDARQFHGKFADYLAESHTPDPIELKIGGKKVLLPVPSKKQIVKYFEARSADDLKADERTEKVWRALLLDEYDRVMDFYDEQPFHEWRAFSKFVEETWFGPGADDVEGN